ncbi:arylsulfatase [Aquirhabdus parva]|uniref:Arylsulfatase n=1 Tax=Aquirhabdus parva TaxID=2283318 RepID=A0A345P6K0_9GAMM|nr:arylsulfatase [Aquirhabdus parva]AXI02909.1 arylsulfatase [Aquirhabdus parva]
MSRTPLRLSLLMISIVSITLLSGCNSQDDSPVPLVSKRPNILFILADDLGYSDIGAFGGEIKTPNLDALASEGRLLTDYHTAPTCSPTRSQLLSGTDHHLAGLGAMAELLAPQQVGHPGYEGYLNQKSLSLPELLKDNGYDTYMAGKWHLGLTEALSPKARGFEKSFVLLQGGDLHFGTAPTGYNRGTYREDGVLVNVPNNFYSSDFYTDKLISYIGQSKTLDKPFFAYAAYTAPHWPLQAPSEYIDRYKGKYDAGYDAIRLARIERQKKSGVIPTDFQPSTVLPESNIRPKWQSLTLEQRQIESRKMEVYAAMVENLDHNIGRLIQHLKDIGEYDNTLIFFASDNGAEGFVRGAPKGFDNSLSNIGHDNSYTYIGPRWAEVSAAPFHLWKDTTGEGGVVAPALVKLPKQFRSEANLTQFTSVIDVLPTLLDISKTPNPGTQYHGREVNPTTGFSLLPLLENKTKTPVRGENFVFADELHGNSYVRKGQWKLELQVGGAVSSMTWELYDLSTDRGENHNVADQHPDIVADLKREYDNYSTRVGLIPYYLTPPSPDKFALGNPE